MSPIVVKGFAGERAKRTSPDFVDTSIVSKEKIAEIDWDIARRYPYNPNSSESEQKRLAKLRLSMRAGLIKLAATRIAMSLAENGIKK